MSSHPNSAQVEQFVAAKAAKKTLDMAEKVEKQLDDVLKQYDNMSTNDFEELRRKRIGELRKKQEMMTTWKAQGHGKLEEIADEKTWFEETKSNKWVICHFYRSTTKFCELLDSHLMKLAPKHMETRFIKIDAEKCNYLVTKLNITVMPTIIMTEENFVCDRLEGFTELGNTSTFTTETLEKRLAKKGVIDYTPPPKDLKIAQEQSQKPSGIYESARTKLLEQMDFDDNFLDTTDEE